MRPREAAHRGFERQGDPESWHLVEKVVYKAGEKADLRTFDARYRNENFGDSARTVLAQLPKDELAQIVSLLPSELLRRLSAEVHASGDSIPDLNSVDGWRDAFRSFEPEVALVLQNAALLYAESVDVDVALVEKIVRDKERRKEVAAATAREIMADPKPGDVVEWSSGRYEVESVESDRVRYRYVNTLFPGSQRRTGTREEFQDEVDLVQRSIRSATRKEST